MLMITAGKIGAMLAWVTPHFGYARMTALL
jgi:hypothetical protein